MNAQVDQNLLWAHTSEGTFSMSRFNLVKKKKKKKKKNYVKTQAIKKIDDKLNAY